MIQLTLGSIAPFLCSFPVSRAELRLAEEVFIESVSCIPIYRTLTAAGNLVLDDANCKPQRACPPLTIMCGVVLVEGSRPCRFT